jgi:glycosyltransferase involved in cell wall biosynthesis
VLQVVTDTDRRGAQRFAVDLGRALAALGHDVRTVALAEGRVGGLDLPVLGPSRRSPTTLANLRRAMAGAEVAVAHGSTTLPACVLAGAGLATPFVYRQISESRFWAATPARRVRVRASLARAAAVVALWPGAARVLTEDFGVAPARVTVIPNGVPEGRFPVADDDARHRARVELGLPAAAPVVACLGALEPEKGVDLVVEAVGRLGPPTILVVAGDGSRRDELVGLAERVAPGRVRLLGSTERPDRVVAAADVVALASRGGDSMPAVLVEAAMSGRPVVATPVEGIVEIVEDGVTGLLVPVGDLDALTGALAGLVAAPDRGRALGAAAAARARSRWDIDVVAAAWSDLLDRVAPHPPGT